MPARPLGCLEAGCIAWRPAKPTWAIVNLGNRVFREDLLDPLELTTAKARGVNDVAFHKKRGLAVEDMVKSGWVYRKLRNFRAGIEAGISCLKRAYGLARCTWRGLDHFKTYIWSAVVAHNLVLFARLKPA